MKVLSFILALYTFVPVGLCAQDRYVYDKAEILTEEHIQKLADRCKAIEDSAGTQVVIYISTSDLKTTSIEKFSMELAQGLGIGQDKADNGVLILILPSIRKSRIEVGYGLEGILTDLKTSRIQRDYFKPHFREGNYFTGINLALLEIEEELIASNKPVDPILVKENLKAIEDSLDVFITFIWICLGLMGLGIIWSILDGLGFFVSKKEKSHNEEYTGQGIKSYPVPTPVHHLKRKIDTREDARERHDRNKDDDSALAAPALLYAASRLSDSDNSSSSSSSSDNNDTSFGGGDFGGGGSNGSW